MLLRTTFLHSTFDLYSCTHWPFRIGYPSKLAKLHSNFVAETSCAFAVFCFAVFAMNTKSEKQREYSDPDTYAMDGDHTIDSRKDTGTCSCYVVDTYK